MCICLAPAVTGFWHFEHSPRTRFLATLNSLKIDRLKKNNKLKKTTSSKYLTKIVLWESLPRINKTFRKLHKSDPSYIFKQPFCWFFYANNKSIIYEFENSRSAKFQAVRISPVLSMLVQKWGCATVIRIQKTSVPSAEQRSDVIEHRTEISVISIYLWASNYLMGKM